MSPSFDCSSSTLLCVEDNDSILGFDDDDDEEEEEEEEEEGGHRLSWVPEPKRCDFYGDLLVDFPLQSDEFLSLLVERELEHLPREDYGERFRSGALKPSIRRDAIDWMWKVHAYYNFGPLTAYLSVNYFDRFLSEYELPQGKTWMTQLLSVACLSLAAKMEKTDVPQSPDLQQDSEAKYVFEARAILRMELMVLNTLKWRMQAVTPFSFIDFFLHKFNGDNAPNNSSIVRSSELILSTTRGTDFLAFRPSAIAAAIALLVLGEIQIVDVQKALSSCSHVAKEGVLECYEVIQDKMLMRKQSTKEEFMLPSILAI
ncbi:hypothetical protein OPV22_024263 [Ensete ventricosum]|uniref:Cyclin N-terminal domain-containing protein n=1 Tax=Ensete ventricosum TaxID=4639 RepID=A0AAV8QP44_ENSVE|nr:hypothetical protein OPV22_024263 [Ensete ventricosum]